MAGSYTLKEAYEVLLLFACQSLQLAGHYPPTNVFLVTLGTFSDSFYKPFVPVDPSAEIPSHLWPQPLPLLVNSHAATPGEHCLKTRSGSFSMSSHETKFLLCIIFILV